MGSQLCIFCRAASPTEAVYKSCSAHQWPGAGPGSRGSSIRDGQHEQERVCRKWRENFVQHHQESDRASLSALNMHCTPDMSEQRQHTVGCCSSLQAVARKCELSHAAKQSRRSAIIYGAHVRAGVVLFIRHKTTYAGICALQGRASHLGSLHCPEKAQWARKRPPKGLEAPGSCGAWLSPSTSFLTY